MSSQRNVLGGPLTTCSDEPLTGFFRTGCCDTSADDVGSHTICTQLTAEFLAFSQSQGNDLSTPRLEFGFPGLRPGNRWCICAARWKEAMMAGVAPPVVLAATNESALEIVTFEELKPYAIDPVVFNIHPASRNGVH